MSEPATTTVHELMSRDPLSLTKSDLTEIVAYYRENRVKFLTTGKTPPKPKASKYSDIEVNLGDITL